MREMGFQKEGEGRGQIVREENIHTASITQTELVVFRNTCVYTYACINDLKKKPVLEFQRESVSLYEKVWRKEKVEEKYVIL